MRSAAAMIVLLAPLSAAAAPPPALHRETLVCAPALEAWRLWTTNEGVASFFPGALNGGTNIKLAADGPYEIYFLPENAVGMRGCDGCTVLGWQEGKMLSFTWTNRPEMAVRQHRTHVVLRFESRTPGRTRVTLDQDGWGEGDDWRIAYDYFADAWTRVLDAFRIRLDAACGEGAASR
jgi:uncharacterized protein YndB with AHSA1/START domain